VNTICQDSRSVQPQVNHILQTLPFEEYERLVPQLQPVALVQGQVLFDVGARIAGGYFVNTGLVSCLTVMQNGDMRVPIQPRSSGQSGKFRGADSIEIFIPACM
jgi:hypothetical protein